MSQIPVKCSTLNQTCPQTEPAGLSVLVLKWCHRTHSHTGTLQSVEWYKTPVWHQLDTFTSEPLSNIQLEQQALQWQKIYQVWLQFIVSSSVKGTNGVQCGQTSAVQSAYYGHNHVQWISLYSLVKGFFLLSKKKIWYISGNTDGLIILCLKWSLAASVFVTQFKEYSKFSNLSALAPRTPNFSVFPTQGCRGGSTINSQSYWRFNTA